METREIREMVRRLARPYAEGRVVVEGAAIRAEGSDFDAVEAWLLANGGQRQEPPKKPARGGLHGDHFADSNVNRNPSTARYVLPAASLEPSPGEEGAAADESVDAHPPPAG